MIVDEGPRLVNYIGNEGLSLEAKQRGKKTAQASPIIRKKLLPPLQSMGQQQCFEMSKFQTQKLVKHQSSKPELKTSKKQLFGHHHRTKSN